MGEKKLEDWVGPASGFSSDSRNVAAGEIFVALKGEKVDGHDFVMGLLARSDFHGYVVSKDFYGSNEKTLLAKGAAAKFFRTDDPHKTHRELAALFRSRFKGPVIGVGGSSGKTSCKEFLSQILSKVGLKTVATEKSQNGELGIPKTLEKLKPDVEVAVVEIGIDGPGDMIRHVTVAQPSAAVLTSIGEEHLNLLKNLEGVFKEERILFDDVLKRGGPCFAPQADEWLQKFSKSKNVFFTPDSPEKVDPSFKTNLSGIYARRNAALAASVVLHLFPKKKSEIAQALAQLMVPEGRGRVFTSTQDVTWMEDHYNSNPSSLRAALTQLTENSKDGRDRILILGDMLDLGEATSRLHQALLPDLLQLKAQKIFLIGPQMSSLQKKLEEGGSTIAAFANSAEAAKALDFSKWKKCWVLFKGSRGMALEKVLEKFKSQQK